MQGEASSRAIQRIESPIVLYLFTPHSRLHAGVTIAHSSLRDLTQQIQRHFESDIRTFYDPHATIAFDRIGPRGGTANFIECPRAYARHCRRMLERRDLPWSERVLCVELTVREGEEAARDAAARLLAFVYFLAA